MTPARSLTGVCAAIALVAALAPVDALATRVPLTVLADEFGYIT